MEKKSLSCSWVTALHMWWLYQVYQTGITCTILIRWCTSSIVILVIVDECLSCICFNEAYVFPYPLESQCGRIGYISRILDYTNCFCFPPCPLLHAQRHSNYWQGSIPLYHTRGRYESFPHFLQFLTLLSPVIVGLRWLHIGEIQINNALSRWLSRLF